MEQIVECVYKTSDRTVAQLLRSALESHGIEAILQGEHLSSLQGALPAGASAEFRVALIDDEQLPQATRIVEEWLQRRTESIDSGPWACAECGETHEPQFLTCWKCGADRGRD